MEESAMESNRRLESIASGLSSVSDHPPKEMHEMKIRDDKSDSQEEDNMKDLELVVVSGSRTETGQIIVTTVGDGIGQEKKTLSFMFVRKVGKGSSGDVFEAKCLETGESVAIKKMRQYQSYKDGELQMTRLLYHPNVVQMKHFFYTKTEKNEVCLHLVLEYVSETFNHYTRMNHQMLIFDVKLYTYQIIRGLNYLHNVIGVCHRDILPQNLLVNPDTHQLKICDFGTVKTLVPDGRNILNMRPCYTIPMGMFRATKYPTEIDMRSAGWVMAELLIGQPLFASISHVDDLVEIIKKLGTPTTEEIRCMNRSYIEFKFPKIKAHAHQWYKERMPAEAVDLVLSLLQYSPSPRCTALELCAHRFFDSLREPNACLPDGRSLPPLFNFTPQELSGACDECLGRLIPAHARENGI